MAEAKSPNPSSLCLTNHFGRKEAEFCTIVMKIEDIAEKIHTTRNGECFKSNTLKCGDIKFKLRIYPNGNKPHHVGEISAGILANSGGTRQWESMEILAAENSQGEFLNRSTKVRAHLLKTNEARARAFNVALFQHDIVPIVLAEENSTYFPDGVLAVKIIIKVQGEETETHQTTKTPLVTPDKLNRELVEHFRGMLESGKFTDFQIICQGEAIPCHRNVLSARSEIFEAMLDHNMKESETGEVEINDFSLITVKAIIDYMYTGEVDYTAENAEDVVRAADKYGLEGLKKVIEDGLIKDIKIENAIDMFVLGDAVHADNLRDAAKAVIVSNAATIVEMGGWREALGRFQDLTFEIFESVIKKRS